MTTSEMLGKPEKTAGKMAEKHLFFFFRVKMLNLTGLYDIYFLEFSSKKKNRELL